MFACCFPNDSLLSLLLSCVQSGFCFRRSRNFFASEEEKLTLSQLVMQFLFIHGVLKGYFACKFVINHQLLYFCDGGSNWLKIRSICGMHSPKLTQTVGSYCDDTLCNTYICIYRVIAIGRFLKKIRRKACPFATSCSVFIYLWCVMRLFCIKVWSSILFQCDSHIRNSNWFKIHIYKKTSLEQGFMYDSAFFFVRVAAT